MVKHWKHSRWVTWCCVPLLTSLSVLLFRASLRHLLSPRRDTPSVLAPETLSHPFYGSHSLCGNGSWIRDYAAVHAAMRRDRVLVSIGVEAGLGDRLLGVMSEFFWAVLSGRALLLTSYADGSLPRWQDAVKPVLFDWQAEESDFAPELTLPLHYTYQGQRGYNGDRSYPTGVDTALISQFYMVNRNRDVFLYENLTEFAGGKGALGRKSLFVASNRGGVENLFTNRHHRAWMRDAAQLTRETAWACGFRVLFQPSQPLLALYEPIFSRLRKLNGRCVSVNIRAGDEVLAGRETIGALSPTHEAYFECAMKASKDALNVSMPWYVTSDSPDLRRLVLQRWGDQQVITDPVTHYVHGDCKHHRHPCTPELEKAAILHAFGQLYAMTLCNTHIFDVSSSFSRSAAFATPSATMYTFNFRGQCSLQTTQSIAGAAAGY